MIEDKKIGYITFERGKKHKNQMVECACATDEEIKPVPTFNTRVHFNEFRTKRAKKKAKLKRLNLMNVRVCLWACVWRIKKKPKYYDYVRNI